MKFKFFLLFYLSIACFPSTSTEFWCITLSLVLSFLFTHWVTTYNLFLFIGHSRFMTSVSLLSAHIFLQSLRIQFLPACSTPHLDICFQFRPMDSHIFILILSTWEAAHSCRFPSSPSYCFLCHSPISGSSYYPTSYFFIHTDSN